MAEEENGAVEETAEDTEKVKKSPLKKLIVLGLGLIVLSGGGFAGWKFLSAEKPLLSGSSGKAKMAEASMTPGIMYQMEPFIVNLLDEGGKRYLKIQFEIEVDNEEVQKALQKRSPQIRDAILLLLTSKSFGQIGVPAGKVELRTELVERINGVLKTGNIRTLYFTEFVIQ